MTPTSSQTRYLVGVVFLVRRRRRRCGNVTEDVAVAAVALLLRQCRLEEVRGLGGRQPGSRRRVGERRQVDSLRSIR